MAVDKRVAVVLGVRLLRREDAGRRVLDFTPSVDDMTALDADGLALLFGLVGDLVATARADARYAGWRVQGKRGE